MDDEGMDARARESAAPSRAASVSLADFSEAISSGILRALDAREREGGPATPRHWVLFGGWIGDGMIAPPGPPGTPPGGQQKSG